VKKIEIKIIKYEYPDRITVLIGEKMYEYKSSEFFCRKLMERINCGARFAALSWFKANATLIGRG
jgi:hypothetical protein